MSEEKGDPSVAERDSKAATTAGPSKEVYTYTLPHPVYAFDWSNRTEDETRFRLCVASFLEKYDNYITWNCPQDRYQLMAYNMHPYLPSKLMFQPQCASPARDLFITSSDSLYLWSIDPEMYIRKELIISHSPRKDRITPCTSFDWNDTDTRYVCNASVDRTCTLWDIEEQKAVMQIIAHDQEVYDVAFTNGVSQFCSAGEDGSVRLFDFRDNRNSNITVLYSGETPIQRISWNKQSGNEIAFTKTNDPKAYLMDIRMPTEVLQTLGGHSGAVNCLSWAPHSGDHMCTGTEDGKVLIWDIRSEFTEDLEPILSYSAPMAVDNLRWSVTHKEWIAICFNETIQVLRV